MAAEQMSLGLEEKPMSPEKWDYPMLVEGTHEKMLLRNIQLLKASEPGSEQYIDILWWVNQPELKKSVPLSFQRCCEVLGISDPELVRHQIMIRLNIVEDPEEFIDEEVIDLEDFDNVVYLS